MQTPEFLKAGDKIGIVAPARSVLPEDTALATSLFERFGLICVQSKNLYGKNHQFSGSDAERAADIQQFLDDENIKAIICARGGYGSVRVLPLLKWDKFKTAPKWFIGYSDITAFHSIINNMNIETLHAPMVFNIGKPDYSQECITAAIDCAMGKLPDYNFQSNALNIQGKAKGKLVGGNLSVLFSLRGTPADLQVKGKILFLEDIDEYLYHIDRMLMNLKYGGVLDSLRGIVVGDMTDMKDNAVPFGKNAYEIIAEHAEDLGIPVCYGFPAGHGFENHPLALGHEVVLEVGKSCNLKFC